jgi:hypothetical protein
MLMFKLALIPLLSLSVAVVSAQATHDARIVSYEGLSYPCDAGIIPRLKIQNEGSTTMSTCVVETWKNGLQVNSFNWELAVPALEGEVREPAFPAVPDCVAGDLLEFRIISVNGLPDQVALGNIRSVQVGDQPTSGESYLVMIETRTDDAPEETSWTIRASDGSIAVQSGPFAIANDVVQQWVTLAANACYDLRVFDSSANGNGSGYVRVYSADVLLIDTAMEQGVDELRAGFMTGSTVGVTELAPPDVRAYPVPTGALLHIEWPGSKAVDAAIQVMDGAGRTVMQAARYSIDGTLVLDLTALTKGTYVVVVHRADVPPIRVVAVRQ